MSPVSVDQKYLEYLFESRGRESVMKMENSKIQVILAPDWSILLILASHWSTLVIPVSHWSILVIFTSY